MDHAGLEVRMVTLEEFTIANLRVIATLTGASLSLKSDLISLKIFCHSYQFTHILILEDSLAHNLYSHFISGCHKQILSLSRQRHIEDIALNHNGVSVFLRGKIKSST